MADPDPTSTPIPLVGMDKLVKEVLAHIKTRGDQPELPTGLDRLDDAIWGLHRTEVTVVAARPGEGKCLGKGTPVLMADGTTKVVEHIQVGDELMGPDSRPRRVVSLTQGRERLYEIQQRNGLWYTVNASHFLSLKRSNREVRNISVTSYLKQSAKFKHQFKGYKVPVEFPDTPVPIPPYILGLWLGDGTNEATTLTTQDEIIRTAWEAYGASLGLHCRITTQSDRCATYTLANLRGKGNPFRASLQHLGIFGRRRKAIPDIYLRNHRAIRLELLAGLIDTDGARNNCGLIFYNTNHLLAEQVCWLARSLGFRAQCTPYMAKLASRHYTCQAYKVTVTGAIHTIPLRVRYKMPMKQSMHHGCSTNFRVVDKGEGNYYGFTLHHPDGLFLLGDFTVTHNTTMALQMAGHLADLKKRVLFLSLEMNVHQIVERWLIQLTRTNAWQLRTGSSTSEFCAKVETLDGYFTELPMHCLDDQGLTVSELTSLLQEMAKQDGPPDILFIDFIQLIEAEEDGISDMEAIKHYLRAVKRLAKRYNMAVVICSQINREGGRSGKLAPKLIHLKGSGAIEELADCVLMLWWQELGTEEEPQGTRYWVCVEKQRYGPPGQKIPIQFDTQHLTFLAAEPPVSPWPAREDADAVSGA